LVAVNKKTIQLIDWDNPDENDFAIAEEVTIKGIHKKRPDIVLYINGIAVGVLEQGTDDELRAEIARQLAAGKRNGNRFIMSIGSPATPDTPPARVRQYCELTRAIAGQ